MKYLQIFFTLGILLIMSILRLKQEAGSEVLYTYYKYYFMFLVKTLKYS